MRSSAGPRRPITALAALLAGASLAASGCERGAAAEPRFVTGSAAPSAPAAAPAAARVGAAASGCKLPVSFAIAESYKAKAVRVDADDPLAALTRRGPLTMACEIDAKPAGAIGFLRVWTGTGDDLRAGLTAFLGKGAQAAVFTERRIGDRPALEVVYQQKSELEETVEPERAFAVRTARGLVAVSLDSLDGDEHEDILPAYELAKATLTVTG